MVKIIISTALFFIFFGSIKAQIVFNNGLSLTLNNIDSISISFDDSIYYVADIFINEQVFLLEVKKDAECDSICQYTRINDLIRKYRIDKIATLISFKIFFKENIYMLISQRGSIIYTTGYKSINEYNICLTMKSIKEEDNKMIWRYYKI